MKISILGAGAWGTTLSSLLAKKYFSWPNLEIYLWDRDTNLIQSMKKEEENKRYLKGIIIPQSIYLTASIEESARCADFIIFATSSSGIIPTAHQLSPYLENQTIIISASKGLILSEDDKFPKRLSSIIKETLNIEEERVGVISGPTFAIEVAQGLPTALVASSYSYSTAEKIQQLFFLPHFRVYTNSDIIGVELGGALKNIIAIAAGITDGLKLGDSSKAALLTRGLAEMIRLGKVMGAQEVTFAGLAGIGDLVATAYSKYSRNRRFGQLLAEGYSKEEAIKTISHVVEGISTSAAVIQLKENYNIEMPITQEVYSIIFEGKGVPAAKEELLARKYRSELIGGD